MEESGESGVESGEESELTLPKTALREALKAMLPPGMEVDKKTEGLLMESCIAFIRLLTSQAEEIRKQGTKRAIQPWHVIEALKELELANHKELQELQELAQEHETGRVAKNEKKKRDKAGIVEGMTEEETLAEQLALFAAAKARMKSRDAASQQPESGASGSGL